MTPPRPATTTAPPSRLVVAHPDLTVPVALAPGAVVVLEDPVGATVVGTVLGEHRSGRVHLDGRRLRRRGLAGRVRRGLAVVSGAPVAPDVSVLDHLAAVVGRGSARAALDGAPLLAGRGDDPAGVLSGGERRVLAWLRATAVGPRAVVLDHAGQGLDAATLAWAGGVVEEWVGDGVAVLVRPGRDEERAWAAAGHDRASPAD